MRRRHEPYMHEPGWDVMTREEYLESTHSSLPFEMYQAFWNSRMHYTKEEYDLFEIYNMLEYYYNSILNKEDTINVLQINGWRGELAFRCVGLVPYSKMIGKWDNYVISPKAIKENTFIHPKYRIIEATNYPWNIVFFGYHICFLCHVIEYMTQEQLVELVRSVYPISCVFVEANIPQLNKDAKSGGSKLLQCGWEGVKEAFTGYFEKIVNEKVRVYLYVDYDSSAYKKR